MRPLVVVGLLLSLGGFAHAQSLGENSRRAQEKKQAPRSPAPT